MPYLTTIRSLQGLAFCGAILALAGCATPDNGQWRRVLDASADEDWRESWFLEGNRASVQNISNGFIFSAGDELNNPASHAVLWSKRSFSGDVRVEYDYTRLDSMMEATSVNILYLQASGIGDKDNPADIYLSTGNRQVPLMKSYFLGMNLLHISYAASGPERSNYVSARHYPASTRESFEQETQIQPIYDNVELFEPGTTYHIIVTKQGSVLSLTVEDGGNAREFRWDTAGFAAVTSGRIGLRHMWGRRSRYQNLRIYVKD